MDPVSTISYLRKVKDQRKELKFPGLIDFGAVICILFKGHLNLELNTLTRI